MINMFKENSSDLGKKEALFYEKKSDKDVKCFLCPVNCTITEGQVGSCKARKNIDGTLYTLNYGLLSSQHADPIEKKPFFHFFPGSNAFSIGTLGCNMSCDHCQNWRISTIGPEEKPRFQTTRLKPQKIVDKAKKHSNIAYTYNEPTIWYEFVKDTAELAHENNLKNVLVTNGYINEKPFRELAPYIDAMNIDIKSFDEYFYRRICHVPSGEESKNTAILAHELGIHIELTYLVITNENDSIEEIEKFIEWVKTIDSEIPVHFSRYRPQHEMDNPSTSIKKLEKAYEKAQEKGLANVYIGNVRKKGTEDTNCPECGEKILERSGFTLKKSQIEDGNCKYCGREIKGIFKN